MVQTDGRCRCGLGRREGGDGDRRELRAAASRAGGARHTTRTLNTAAGWGGHAPRACRTVVKVNPWLPTMIEHKVRNGFGPAVTARPRCADHTSGAAATLAGSSLNRTMCMRGMVAALLHKMCA